MTRLGLASSALGRTHQYRRSGFFLNATSISTAMNHGISGSTKVSKSPKPSCHCVWRRPEANAATYAAIPQSVPGSDKITILAAVLPGGLPIASILRVPVFGTRLPPGASVATEFDFEKRPQPPPIRSIDRFSQLVAAPVVVTALFVQRQPHHCVRNAQQAVGIAVTSRLYDVSVWRGKLAAWRMWAGGNASGGRAGAARPSRTLPAPPFRGVTWSRARPKGVPEAGSGGPKDEASARLRALARAGPGGAQPPGRRRHNPKLPQSAGGIIPSCHSPPEAYSQPQRCGVIFMLRRPRGETPWNPVKERPTCRKSKARAPSNGAWPPEASRPFQPRQGALGIAAWKTGCASCT